MKKILISVLAATVLLTTLVGCDANTGGDATETTPPTITSSDSQTNSQSEAMVQPILATAGDISVSLTDFTFFKQASRMEVEQQAVMFGIIDEEGLADMWAQEITEDGFTMWDSLKQQALETGKRLAVLHNLAIEAGTALDESVVVEMEQGLGMYLEMLSEDEAEAGRIFEDRYGVSPAHALDVEKRMSKINTFLSEFAHSLVITEEDVRAVYDENPDNFDLVTVRHVLISSNNTMTDEERAEATERAEEIYRRIVAGEPIGELASIYSEDPGSAHADGEYTFPRGQMVPEFEDWSFSAEIDDKGIVLSSFGYHVMQFMGRTSFEDVKDSIHHNLQHVRAEQDINNVIDEFAEQWVLDQELFDSIVL